jgi:hypothetical protein
MNTQIGTKLGAAAVLLVSLALAGNASAQHSHPGELGLVESGGEARGYAIIQQVLDEGRAPYIQIHLQPYPSSAPPEEWTWEINDPPDSTLEHNLTFEWYAQASCPDDLTDLRVNGPGGLQVQNPLANPIWGYFYAQSFTLDTVKNVCLDWANANNCDIYEPGIGCELYETFSLVGGLAPATNTDRLHLQASCASGPVANSFYAPVLQVRCSRDGS